MKYPDDFVDKVICGKAEEVMKYIPDEVIDLTVTSPPYDNLRTYDGYEFNFKEIARELYRITKKGGVVVWVVGDATINGSETGTSFKQALYFKEIGFNLHDTMIYEKNGTPFFDGIRYLNCFEYMFVLSKGKPKTINLLRDRKNKYKESWGDVSIRTKNGNILKKEKKKYNKFGVRFNIWRIDCGKGFSTKDEIAYEHPAIFPEALARDHILSWSNKGDIVLDPMCGSGTTLKMAKKLNRHYIGIDISPRYCEIARLRVAGQKYRIAKNQDKLPI